MPQNNPLPVPPPCRGEGVGWGSRFAALLDQIDLPETPRRTLSIGCGAFSEYDLLHQRWQGWLHLGVDWDREALRTAPPNAVIVADAQQLPFACTFSLIMIRHPDISKYLHSWTAILQQMAPILLANEGLLVITTYSLDEWEFVQRTIALPRWMAHTFVLPPFNLVGEDKHIVICKK